MIYLAQPFWHKEEMVRLLRYNVARREAIRLIVSGQPVFSPIVHNHHLTLGMPEHLQHSHDFWMSIDLPILRRATSVLAMRLPGWEDSKGLAVELEEAIKRNIPITNFYLPEGEAAFHTTMMGPQ